MTNYECEIRFILNDVKLFQSHLQSIDHEIIKEYSFSDHVFRPLKLTKKWEGFEKIMRIRSWTIPTVKSEVLFSNIKYKQLEGFRFKQAIFSEGKVNFFTGEFEKAKNIVKELDFSPWFIIKKKKGKLMQVKKKNFTFVLEEIERLGHSIEIEVWGQDIQQVKKRFYEIIEILNLKREDGIHFPLAKIYFDAINT